jgi:hypothetical protein
MTFERNEADREPPDKWAAFLIGNRQLAIGNQTWIL